jgi:ribonuclease BN (tRNA processing enzyme)
MSGVEVTFVGSGDAFGNGGRAQTCIRLRTPQLHALVDCGSTSLTALKDQGVDPGSVDLVAITHLHADHFGGLPFLVLDGQFTHRTRPLRVLGPPGTRERLRAAMEVGFPGSSTVDRRFAVDVDELVPDGTPWTEDRIAVQGWEVDHASGAPPLCLRLQAGDRVVAYSGDTAWTDALTLAATDADLFAVEAYTYDRPVRYHLDYRTLCDHARQLPSHRTVLTHMSPTMLARIADAEHPAAYDGMTVTL